MAYNTTRSDTYMTSIVDDTHSETRRRDPNDASSSYVAYRTLSVRTVTDDKRVIGISIYNDPAGFTTEFDETQKERIHKTVVGAIKDFFRQQDSSHGGF